MRVGIKVNGKLIRIEDDIVFLATNTKSLQLYLSKFNIVEKEMGLNINTKEWKLWFSAEIEIELLWNSKMNKFNKWTHLNILVAG